MPLSPSALLRTTAGAWIVAAVVGLLFAVGLATAPSATADTCDNATLRAQNNSTGLPNCRAYEMVTPPYKEGFGVLVGVRGQLPDDAAFFYGSLGSFAGNNRATFTNAYTVARSPAGWMTTALAPPDTILDSQGASASWYSADRRWTLSAAKRRDVPGDTYGFWLRDPDGGFTRIGDAIEASGAPRAVVGVSQDLSHVVFLGDDIPRLFEYVGTGNGAAGREVSVDNHGQACSGNAFDFVTDVSDDGRVIIYTAKNCWGVGRQVWARVAGSATVAVSGSECTRGAGDPGGVCNGVSDAVYGGRSADGSRVVFTTSQQLVNGDTDAGNDVYACDVPSGVPAPVGAANPCSSLIAVTATAGDAQVENVVGVSQDGSRVYFVAKGVLADNLGADGLVPATAADVGPGQEPHNLYVWERDGAHPAGTTRFVARLTGPTGNDLERSQVTPDGRYLLFVSANQLVTSGPGADSDSVKDAYRYDAVTHAIVRVSTSVSGSGGNDPSPGSDVSLTVASSMSADGSTVIFDSSEALSAADIDGVRDVYSWRDGQVSLISAGGGSSLGITPSGRDIFFETAVPVLAADGNPNTDIYDARVGGGFAAVARAVPCSGDGCQGLLSGPPLLSGPGSGGSGGGDADEGVRPAIGGIARLSSADRSVLARGGRARLRLTVNRAGRVTLAGRAKVGTRSLRVVSSSARARKAGRVSVAFALSRSARAQLGRRGSLTIGLTIRFGDARPKTLTVTLKAAKPKPGRGGSR